MKIEDSRSHAHIISAPAEEGYAAARALAQAMLCSQPREGSPCGVCEHCRKAEKGIHPDIITVSRRSDESGTAKRELYVEQIRDLVADAAILPNEAEQKVYIIRDAGSMNAAAQNALLKILEEPPYFVSFILVADNAGQLLETVRSRCVTHYLNAGEDAPAAEARDLAEEFLGYAAAGARISLISFANEHGDMNNAALLDFVRAARLLLADMLCGRLSPMRMSRGRLLALCALVDKAERYLLANVGGKQVLGLLAVEAI